MTRTFRIEPADTAAVATLYALAALCAALAITCWVMLPMPTLLSILIVAPVLGVGLLMAWFAIVQRRSSVTIKDRQVVLTVPLYARVIPLEEFVAGSVAKIDPSSDPDVRLTWRTKGLSVPGYNLGWFRTRGAGTVLAAVTSGPVVKWSMRGDYSVLLSINDADGFLAALDPSLIRTK